MKVTFTKVDVKRYEITIVREHGPALLPRYGPGYDDLMPHDLAHYLVEESYGIELGVGANSLREAVASSRRRRGTTRSQTRSGPSGSAQSVVATWCAPSNWFS